MEIMYGRKSGKRYEIYGVDLENNMALGYDTTNSKFTWCKISIASLIPETYYISDIEIKQHLKLVDAMWMTSDGCMYDNKHLNNAIKHQRELVNNNK